MKPKLSLVQLLTVDQAAFRLQMSPKTVRRLINSGELQAIRIGRVVRIDPRELDRFVAVRKTT